MSTSLVNRLNELERFREDFEAGAYPQRSALGPGAISKNFIKSKSITASALDVSNLEAVSASTGSLNVTGDIIVGSAGAIRSGLTAYNDTSNKGYWLGVDSGTAKLLIGGQLTATTPRVHWDGTNLTVVGVINAESGYLKSLTVNGTLDLASSGVIKSGKSGYGSGTGIWIEYNGGSPRFDIGTATRYMRFDGTNLTFTGSLSGVDGTFSGTLSGATGSFTGSLSASSLTITGTANFSGGSLTLPGGGSITSAAFDINSATFAGITVDGTITLGSGGKIVDGDGSVWDQSGLTLVSAGSFGDAIRWRSTPAGSDLGSVYITGGFLRMQYTGGGYFQASGSAAILAGPSAVSTVSADGVGVLARLADSAGVSTFEIADSGAATVFGVNSNGELIRPIANDATALGAYFGRIPIYINGSLKYIPVYS